MPQFSRAPVSYSVRPCVCLAPSSAAADWPRWLPAALPAAPPSRAQHASLQIRPHWNAPSFAGWLSPAVASTATASKAFQTSASSGFLPDLRVTGVAVSN